ncbi:unnamed protein product [Ceutorhynchus assimilis]|uniref:SWIM-type domain-containing protein n=1 Tax=Ceutorhynchus assimilis TaxID=467358 RepID=A0A9N9QKN2_9CUCU|nr:unnamed protein product [Ceutorhynchus assimilis]
MLNIIKYGFRPIVHSIERGQNFKKGLKLVEAGYVLDVTEVEKREEKEVAISSKVVAQTRVSVQYAVKIKVNEDRVIQAAFCTCKAGKSGQCRHICAVIVFVNYDESSTSKTSFSQQWGKPSKRQLLEYDKGARINTLYNEPSLDKKASLMVPIPVCSSSLENLSGTPLYVYAKLEELQNEEIVAAQTLLDIRRLTEKQQLIVQASSVVKEILMQQYFSVPYSKNYTLSQKVLEYYERNVSCTSDTAFCIATETIQQSADDKWYKEPRYRITASISHRAKANSRNVNKLVEDLLSTKKIKTAAMIYGTKTESTAIRQYETDWLEPGSHIVKVGLIINLLQPWLACSPDGVVILGNNIMNKRLLEVKCPYTCQDKPIYDEEEKIFNVNYLTIDENGAQLKRSNQIYTQVQIQMYLTNISNCDLYIYSNKGSALVKVPRNEMFLRDVIIKLEAFYFKYYLPKLARNLLRIKIPNQRKYGKIDVSEYESTLKLLLHIMQEQEFREEIMALKASRPIPAQNGILHPLVLSPKRLINHLVKQSMYLPKGLSFPVPLYHHYSHDLYKTMHPNVFYSNYKLYFILYIPLVSDISYNIVKMISLPIKVNNDKLSHIFSFISSEHHYLVIYSLKRNYFFLDNNDLKDCSRIDNKYVCKEKYPLFLLPIHNDCEALLYTHPQKIPESCEKRVSAIHKTIFIKILKKNSWIFVSPNDETLTIKCQNFEDSIRLNISGILELAPHCIAFTSSVTLKPIDTKEANESFINTNYFQNLDIKNEINNQDLRFSFMETLSLNKSILVLPDQNEKLEKISYSIDVLKAKEQKMLNQKSIDFNHIHHYILVYLVVFLIVSYVGFKKYKTMYVNQDKRNCETPSATAESICLTTRVPRIDRTADVQFNEIADKESSELQLQSTSNQQSSIVSCGDNSEVNSEQNSTAAAVAKISHHNIEPTENAIISDTDEPIPSVSSDTRVTVVNVDGVEPLTFTITDEGSKEIGNLSEFAPPREKCHHCGKN